MPRFRGMESTALHAANIALAVQQQTCEQRSRKRCFHRLFASGSTTLWMTGLAASATVERSWATPRMAPMSGGAACASYYAAQQGWKVPVGAAQCVHDRCVDGRPEGWLPQCRTVRTRL